MDPRVKITPDVQQIFTLTTQAENRAATARNAYREARTLVEKLRERPQSAANDALIKQLEDVAAVEAPAPEGGGRGARGAGFGGSGALAEPPPPPTLANISSQMIAAVMAFQGSELPPTASQLRACAQQETAYTSLMAKWSALKAKIQGPPSTKAAGGNAK
jgi:hypothetical protein